MTPTVLIPELKGFYELIVVASFVDQVYGIDDCHHIGLKNLITGKEFAFQSIAKGDTDIENQPDGDHIEQLHNRVVLEYGKQIVSKIQIGLTRMIVIKRSTAKVVDDRFRAK